MYRMLVLICLNDAPVELCREDTAISVTRPVDTFPTQMGCAVASMQALPFLQADSTTTPVIRCIEEADLPDGSLR